MYRELVKETHPDKRGTASSSAEKFLQVRQAYEVLIDPNQRMDYDIRTDGLFAWLVHSAEQYAIVGLACMVAFLLSSRCSHFIRGAGSDEADCIGITALPPAGARNEQSIRHVAFSSTPSRDSPKMASLHGSAAAAIQCGSGAVGGHFIAACKRGRWAHRAVPEDPSDPKAYTRQCLEALQSSAEFQRWSVMGRWKQPERGPPDADLVEWCDLHEDLVVDGRW